jgi:hypothetical protein
VRVEVRGFDLGDLAPCRETGRGDVGPRLAAVARQVDQAGIAAGPHHAGAQRRGRDGIDDAEAEFAGVFGGHGDGGRGFGVARIGAGIAGEIARDLLPGEAAIGGLQQVLRAVVERVGLDG